MKNPFLQLFFGVDTLVALASYLVLTIIFGAIPSIFVLSLSLIFSYLPDFDLFIFFLFRRKFNWKSHWIIAHHPLIITPLVGILIYTLAGIWQLDNFYLLTLFLVNIIAHFIHDSMHPVGFHWFSPFSWKRFVFHRGWFKLANPAIWEARQKKLGLENGIGTEIFLRLEKISSFQVIAMLLLIFSIFGLFSETR